MKIEDIKAHLPIYSQQGGNRLGTVDHLDGQRYVKVAKSDSFDGRHHWFPVDWVEKADDKGVYLRCNEEEFRSNLIHERPVEPAGSRSAA